MEKIIVNIMELEMITKDKDANYFYDGYEMPILCSLIDNIEKNLNIITPIIKRKYCNINWDIINFIIKLYCLIILHIFFYR